MFRDLPRPARWYIVAVVGLGAAIFALNVPRAEVSPVFLLLALVALSALAGAFKKELPITSGSTMTVSYVVDIAALIALGPHAAMIVGAVGALVQSTFNAGEGNPKYRTLFNMSVIVLTIEASGHLFGALGGSGSASLKTIAVPLLGMTATYFVVNTAAVALAVALSTSQNPWQIWKRDFASSAPSYLLGAAAAQVIIAVASTSGAWLAVFLTAAPLYLSYTLYRANLDVEARQGAILEAAHDAILTIDPQLNIREFNRAAERLFGRPRMDVLGRHVELLLPATDRGARLSALSRYQSRGDGPFARRIVELTCVKSDGTEFPCELTVARLGTDSRAIITGFVRDITERRLLEEQVRRSQKLEAIGRLAGGVAHDFNNILMSIVGAADLMLLDSTPGSLAYDEAHEIKRAVHRGASLTRQLLAFSSRQATRPQLLNLNDVVGGMDTMLRRLIGPEIEIEMILQSDGTKVRVDPSQIEQVVLNLVVNARDAMPDGGRVTVTVDRVELDETQAIGLVEGHAGKYARLSVADTGTGMDERTKAQLFEPFFTTKEPGKGTGLGLSIVYGIAKQNGGYITVVSEVGRGASFVVWLPLAALPVPAPVPTLV
jgi:PAS domain S-box-containing protein